MRTTKGLVLVFVLAMISSVLTVPAVAQTETATVSGRVTDPQGHAVPDAEIQLVNIDTNVGLTTKTNSDGLYALPGVRPGAYRILVVKDGFKEIVKTGLVLHVQDIAAENFSLQVGSLSESVTVTADQLNINTTDASVSTVVDRQFAENLPMNGRSFQTLIDLTPGVVLTGSNAGSDTGQFSVNGQRSDSNYWMVDGVSANAGSSGPAFGGNGLPGAAVTSSVLGGTNSLVSVDALQEFRIQTSNFAPEFGRTPGAQISILTRSGGSQFHGSLFDYFRNDVLDASNWFNGYTNIPPLPKAKERQNDFGGTLSGPILKGRTFFFFSYEGLRLRLPGTALTQVPDINARKNAAPAIQPFLNAFPIPNGPASVDSQGNPIPGAAQFNSSFSDPATLDAYSVRIDHKINNRLNLFGRYSYSPSDLTQRGAFVSALSFVFASRVTTQTATVGSTWTVSPHTVDELRFNYSRTTDTGRQVLDSFGGATPLAAAPFPSPYNLQNSFFFYNIFSLQGGEFFSGALGANLQRQFNLVDNISLQRGTHNLKLGFDYRRLSPMFDPYRYRQAVFFNDVPSAETGSVAFSLVDGHTGGTLLFRNLSAFAQDTWHVAPRLTMTYGVRWDTDFAPSSISGPALPAITGFDLRDFSQLALAPAGTPVFKTTYRNFAPRVGIAYELFPGNAWGTVFRSGFGVFYDLATAETGNVIQQLGYPFSSAFNVRGGGTFPLNPSAAAPAPIQPPTAANPGNLGAFDPNLKLPYALQWNAAVEQALGLGQSLSMTYVGSVGRRLIQTVNVLSPNPIFSQAKFVDNAATSDYEALQLQFRRRLSRGLQALASYTWAHAIDTASGGSIGNGSNQPSSAGDSDRGPSDFDIRNGFSAGVTYAIPATRSGGFVQAVTGGWSVNATVQARSAAPAKVFNGNFNQLTNGFAPDVRPDVTPGIPLYLYGPQYPGGKAINNTLAKGACPDGSDRIGPFCNPPTDANGNALRQGNLGRNALRGFGATQLDFALHRDFPLRESLSLQFRAEAFNVLNHPNFGPPLGDLSRSKFGLATQMLGDSLAGGPVGTGNFLPLYQIGGPRSLQLALKLKF